MDIFGSQDPEEVFQEVDTFDECIPDVKFQLYMFPKVDTSRSHKITTLWCVWFNIGELILT